ncbi:MAG: hypothetical protein FWD71_11320 [Oscillospiraceae bacterium]|nr:hypothetical protein [Oscillospiraceae bacterium]
MSRKSKLTAIFIAVLIMTAFMSVSVSSVSATSAVQLIDTDKTTMGDWVGNYGSDGYIIITGDDSIQSIPAYAAITCSDENGGIPPAFWQWWRTGGDADKTYTPDEITSREPSALFTDASKTSRLAACYYDGDFFTATVDVGSKTKTVSFYMLDYDGQSRESDVCVTDENGNDLIDPVYVGSYTTGWYLKFVISGKVQFAFENLSGPNVVLSGIFFDPVSMPDLSNFAQAESQHFGGASAADDKTSVSSAAPPAGNMPGIICAGIIVAVLAGLMIILLRKNIPYCKNDY